MTDKTYTDTDKCQHKLGWHSSVMLDNGRNPLVAYCCDCGRQWACESINFAPIGAEIPQWQPDCWED